MIDLFPLKLLLAPALAVVVLANDLLGALPDDIQFVLDLGAIAVFMGGIFVVMRYRSALAAQEAMGSAWRGERDAERAHAGRLVETIRMRDAEIETLKATLAALEARPDLSAMQEILRSIDTHMVLMHQSIADLSSIKGKE